MRQIQPGDDPFGGMEQSRLPQRQGGPFVDSDRKVQSVTSGEHEEEDSDDSAEWLKRYKAERRKPGRRREHFSSSDESESEKVVYFGQGVLKGRIPTAEEVAVKAAEVVQQQVEVIHNRQNLLRPRLVYHLNDYSSDEEED